MEKPLHVRVAEALGWFGFEPSPNGMWPDEWRGHPPVPIVGEPAKEVPRFDIDWSATGPPIERLRIQFWAQPYDEPRPELWYAGIPTARGSSLHAEGPTPLIAVCNLILALKAAGQLEAA